MTLSFSWPKSRIAAPLAIAGVVACLAAADPARAEGLLVAHFGGEWGHPMSDDLWAIYYNPAGLSLLGGTKLIVSGDFAWRTLDYTRDPAAIDDILEDPAVGAGTPAGDGVAANSGKATLSNFLQSPFIAIGSDFGVKNLGIALGLYVPIGGQTIFDPGKKSDKYPGAVDGVNRWWTVEGTARSIYTTLAAGYRVEPIRLSIGIGLNLVLTEIDNVQARNADGTDSLVANGRLQEGRARIDVSGLDFAASVGLLWEPVDNLFIGASYQSQPNFGEQTLTGDVDLVVGGGPAPANPRSKAEVTQQMPDVIRFGVRYGAPKKWEARISGNFARWSVLSEQCVLNATIDGRSCVGDSPPGKIIIIPRHWKDAWSVRAGGSWWARDNLELVLGVGWDATAIPDKYVEPAFYDADAFELTFGAKWKVFSEKLELMLQYSQFIYPDRDIAPRGRVPRDAADPDGPTWTDIDSIGLRPSARVPDGAGVYKTSIGLVEINVGYKF